MNKSMLDIAIIGAGTAGALAARQLNAAGYTCCIIEKSRGLGGRCSRRNVLDGFSVDLGAPSFAIPYHEHPNLIANINQWISDGFLTEWIFDSADFQTQLPSMKRVELCGSPSMNAFQRHLADGVERITQRLVKKLNRLDDHWQLLDDSGDLIVEAKAVIVTAPAEQTYNLVAPYELASSPDQTASSTVADQHEHAKNPILSASDASLPQYICAITFDEPQTQLSDVYTGEHPVFAKVVRANSKPKLSNTDNDQTPEVWILHSTHQWAQKQNHKEAKSVADEMAEAFCEHFNLATADATKTTAKVVTSHYWRLANHDHVEIKKSFAQYKPEHQPFLWNQELQLGCCADWLSGGGISGALNSSQQLCDHITSQLKQEV